MVEIVNNLDFLIQLLFNVDNYSFFITILPAVIFSLIYFYGKLKISNQWEYASDKFSILLNGIVFINNYIFVPIILLIFVYQFNNGNMSSYLFFLFSILFFIQYVSKLISDKITLKKSNFYKSKVSFSTKNSINSSKLLSSLFETLDINLFNLAQILMTIITYIIGYFILYNSYNRYIILLVFTLVLLILIPIAVNKDSVKNLRIFTIYFKNNQQKSIKARIIEKISVYDLLKIEEIHEKYTKTKFIKMEDVSSIEFE